MTTYLLKKNYWNIRHLEQNKTVRLVGLISQGGDLHDHFSTTHSDAELITEMSGLSKVDRIFILRSLDISSENLWIHTSTQIHSFGIEE